MPVKKILSWLNKYIEELFIFTFLVVLVLLVNVEVFRRYILNNTSAYTDEIARLLFIWTVYLGIPYGVKRKKHIVVDILPEKIPMALNLSLEILANLFFIVFSSIFIYYCLNVLSFMKRVGVITDAMAVPKWIVMMCIPIGFCGGIIRLVQNTLLSINDFKSGKEHKRIFSE